MTQQEQKDLLSYLNSLQGEHKVRVHIESHPKLKKTGNPYIGNIITKSLCLDGFIGKDYKKERLETLGEGEVYTPKPRVWGTLINPYIVEHKGNYYLQMIVEKSSEPVYTIDGVVCDVEVLKPWLTDRSDKVEEVIIRDIKFENIKELDVYIKQNDVDISFVNISFII